MRSPATVRAKARHFIVVGVTLLLGSLTLLANPASTPASAEAQAAPVATPNIIVIMTDDQRTKTLATMPTVRNEIVSLGRRFTGLIPTSTCCPSRAAFLTGNLAHTTGVYLNAGGANGGWPAFNASGYESKTVATALDSAGYRTALFGKYLNGWIVTPESYVPPGWDKFLAMRDLFGGGAAAYYDYQLTGSSPTTSYQRDAADYSTDVLADLAVRFVRRSVPGDPYFVVYAPYGPHSPYTPAPRHRGTWSPAQPYRNAAVNEEDMTDKPAFLQDLPPVDLSAVDEAEVGTGQALRSVDEAAARLLSAAGPELGNTLVVFMSDNGVMWGEHRMEDKYQPYRWATEVPLVLRWDGHIPAGSRGSLAANIDVSATLLEAAGIPDALTMEGQSLLSTQRQTLVLEAVGNQRHPPYCGVRTRDWMFVRFSGQAGAEMYDYRSDPLELNNLALDPAFADKRQELETLTQSLCSPTPPHFTW